MFKKYSDQLFLRVDPNDRAEGSVVPVASGRGEWKIARRVAAQAPAQTWTDSVFACAGDGRMDSVRSDHVQRFCQKVVLRMSSLNRAATDYLTLVVLRGAFGFCQQTVEGCPVEELAIDNYRANLLRVADIVERIPVEQNEVGDFAGFY